MNNYQAASLRPGARIRRKRPSDDMAVYVVERVERVLHPTNKRKNEVVVHAGGQAFKAWEIERADALSGWPRARGAMIDGGTAPAALEHRHARKCGRSNSPYTGKWTLCNASSREKRMEASMWVSPAGA